MSIYYRASSALFLLFSTLSLPVVAAQSCAVPSSVPAAIAKGGKQQVLKVAGNELVYSWSPSHCLIKLSPPKPGASVAEVTAFTVKEWDHAFQCDQQKFGFVVHGLWPQAEGSNSKENSPRYCKSSKAVPSDIVRAHLCTVPGVALMQNEWEAHGTCDSENPQEYFARIEELAARFPVQQVNGLPASTTVGKLKELIAQSNPALLRSKHVGVRLADGRLSEIYVCLDRAYRPAECVPAVGDPADNLEFKIDPIP